VAATLALGLALAGCGGPETPLGRPGHVGGFAGIVVAEEPRAALVGREVLSAGGSAVDAAAAVGLALAVTLPSAAGLGGGGACLLYDPVGNEVVGLDFMSQGGVPGLPRGLFALHARYGRLRWESIVSPAENLARFGTQASRALLVDAGQAPPASDAAALVGGLAEGQRLQQPALAATLGRLRFKGPGDLYQQDAPALAAAINAAGGRTSAAAVRDYLPAWVQPASRPAADDLAHFLPSAGLAAPGAGQTGFVVLDVVGRMAVCGLSMGRPFGTGRFAGETGMLVAELGGVAPMPMTLVSNRHVKEPHLGIAADAAAVVESAIAGRARYEPLPLPRLVPAGSGANAIACASGRPSRKSCLAVTDPGGSGLALAIGSD